MAKKRVLVTGASGMLGATMVKILNNNFEIYGTSKQGFKLNPAFRFMQFDLLEDSYEPLISWSKPDTIIHCAANINLDYCEKDPDAAYKINSDPVKKFLKLIGNRKFIFISSDAVFDDKTSSANEKDITNPLNIYGNTKKVAEDFIIQNSSNSLIIRTTIVGKNINKSKTSFVEWIVDSLSKRKEINLFDNVLFSPITIWSLCNEIEWILRNNIFGLFHISGLESVSKYDFGMSLCNAMDLDKTLIHRSDIEDFNFIARRQKNQTMNSSRYQKISLRSLPTFDDTIKDIVKNYNSH